MTRRPPVSNHMVAWGAGSGAVAGALYTVLYIVIGSMPFDFTPYVLFTGLALSPIGAIFGTIGGIFLGFVSTLFVLSALPVVSAPLSGADLLAIRRKLYPRVFIVPWIFYGLMVIWGLNIYGSFNFLTRSDYIYFVFYPTLIASFACVFAGHRYLLRFYEWTQPQRKSKAKNEEFVHLEDKQKNEDFDLDYDHDIQQDRIQS